MKVVTKLQLFYLSSYVVTNCLGCCLHSAKVFVYDWLYLGSGPRRNTSFIWIFQFLNSYFDHLDQHTTTYPTLTKSKNLIFFVSRDRRPDSEDWGLRGFRERTGQILGVSSVSCSFIVTHQVSSGPVRSDTSDTEYQSGVIWYMYVSIKWWFSPLPRSGLQVLTEV